MQDTIDNSAPTPGKPPGKAYLYTSFVILLTSAIVSISLMAVNDESKVWIDFTPLVAFFIIVTGDALAFFYGAYYWYYNREDTKGFLLVFLEFSGLVIVVVVLLFFEWGEWQKTRVSDQLSNMKNAIATNNIANYERQLAKCNKRCWFEAANGYSLLDFASQSDADVVAQHMMKTVNPNQSEEIWRARDEQSCDGGHVIFRYPLSTAIVYNRQKTFQLFKKVAGDEALHEAMKAAISLDRLTMLRQLLDHAQAVQVQFDSTSLLRELLPVAAADNSIHIVQWMIASKKLQGKNGKHVDQQLMNQALEAWIHAHIWMYHADPAFFDLLIQNGADVNASWKHNDYKNALSFAVEYHDYTLVSSLIQRGADPKRLLDAKEQVELAEILRKAHTFQDTQEPNSGCMPMGD